MLYLRVLAALLAALCSGILPAFASIRLYTLHRDELLGETSSRAEIQRRVAANESRLAMAGQQMGLTQSEMARFFRTFKNSKPAWVRLPEHLDAMSAIHRNGNVYVVRDVIIPAGSSGWEVDLVESHQLVRLFMPASCGNLSVIRMPIKHIAARPRPPLPPRHIETAAASPPPTPAPEATPEAFPPPPHHNAGWLVLLGGILLGIISGGGPPPPQGGPPPPGPPPPCPPAAPTDAVSMNNCSGNSGQ